jgi:hypothetical protein
VLTRLTGVADTLRFVCIANALFATGCLFLVNVILSPAAECKMRISLILLLGSCFGFMRYATTGETYIYSPCSFYWQAVAARSEKSLFSELPYWLLSPACFIKSVFSGGWAYWVSFWQLTVRGDSGIFSFMGSFPASFRLLTC